MAETKAPLLEEQYAPDQAMLVTCIFLNKTRATQARDTLHAFLIKYSRPSDIQNAPIDELKSYFSRLGLYRRADWIAKMARQLTEDPPHPCVLRQKSSKYKQSPCEVGHLAGVGPYACDAWRIFCKEAFYANHGIIVPTQWEVVDPQDKDLKRYVTLKREAKMSNADSAIGSTLSQSLADMHLQHRSSATKEVIADHDSNRHMRDQLMKVPSIYEILPAGRTLVHDMNQEASRETTDHGAVIAPPEAIMLDCPVRLTTSDDGIPENEVSLTDSRVRHEQRGSAQTAQRFGTSIESAERLICHANEAQAVDHVCEENVKSSCIASFDSRQKRESTNSKSSKAATKKSMVHSNKDKYGSLSTVPSYIKAIAGVREPRRQAPKDEVGGGSHKMAGHTKNLST